MKIQEIYAKSILTPCKDFNTNHISYNLNSYRGCTHGCIYCDSRSQKYYVDNFDEEIIVKVNAPFLLRQALRKSSDIISINSGSMCDSYMFGVEDKYLLTRQCLSACLDFGVRMTLITKSNLIERDAQLWSEHRKFGSTCSLTITTCDEKLSSLLEPNAPYVSDRLAAMKRLSGSGALVGLAFMPMLPFITDNLENVKEVLTKAKEHGACFVMFCFGVSLRDRQRDFFYNKLNDIFPELTEKYKKYYKEKTGCNSYNAKEIEKYLLNLCDTLNLLTYCPSEGKTEQKDQQTLFDL